MKTKKETINLWADFAVAPARTVYYKNVNEKIYVCRFRGGTAMVAQDTEESTGINFTHTEQELRRTIHPHFIFSIIDVEEFLSALGDISQMIAFRTRLKVSLILSDSIRSSLDLEDPDHYETYDPNIKAAKERLFRDHEIAKKIGFYERSKGFEK